MGDFSIPLHGLSRATSDFNHAAEQIAQAPTAPPANEPAADSVGLSRAAVDLLQARNDYATNAQAVHVMDTLERTTLDMLA